jgi:hypothetical protein
MIVRFDDNSGIVDHYCLDFIFLIPNYFFISESRIHFKANRSSIK